MRSKFSLTINKRNTHNSYTHAHVQHAAQITKHAEWQKAQKHKHTDARDRQPSYLAVVTQVVGRSAQHRSNLSHMQPTRCGNTHKVHAAHKHTQNTTGPIVWPQYAH